MDIFIFSRVSKICRKSYNACVERFWCCPVSFLSEEDKKYHDLTQISFQQTKKIRTHLTAKQSTNMR